MSGSQTTRVQQTITNNSISTMDNTTNQNNKRLHNMQLNFGGNNS